MEEHAKELLLLVTFIPLLPPVFVENQLKIQSCIYYRGRKIHLKVQLSFTLVTSALIQQGKGT